MKVIGLTGGIGSGKTTVARMFKDLGVPVYNADQEAKNLMNTSDSLKNNIIELFGKNAYKNDILNREFIAQIVFKDKQKLKVLNELVHPMVRNHFSQWIDVQNTSYVIQENPLIFEKNDQNYFDQVITVTAKKGDKIQRVMVRDGISKSQVLDRMANQLDDELKIAGADFVIYNESLEKTRNQVYGIHQQLLLQIP